MDCQSLSQLIPDMVDGTLGPETLAEAEASLTACPDCQRELEIARQVHTFLLELQADNDRFQMPAGFEKRLIQQISRQAGGLDLLDLSSRAFGAWLIELINLMGGLLDPNRAVSQPG